MPETWYEGKHFCRMMTFRFGDCNSNRKASIYTLLKVFSEMGGEDYERRGLGYDNLLKNGQAFVVSRQCITIKRLPRYGETVCFKTWERKVKGPFFYRDFEVNSMDGEVIVTSESMWLLVEPQSREILRPSQIIGGIPSMDDEGTSCEACKRLHHLENPDILGIRTAMYSDLDANGHVNNAVYARIASDYMPEEYRKKDVKVFHINFNAETRLDEVMEISGKEIENGYAMQGSVGETVHFSCRYLY